MYEIVTEVFGNVGLTVLDADSSSGQKDYLERILGLIRGTGFTVALFSNETRQTAFANIALELGFAAMCGKPLVIVKSKAAKAPSDLTRTDWIEYDTDDEGRFRAKLEQAISEITALAAFASDTLEVALEADRMDCAVVFERVKKAFLLTGEGLYIDHASAILERIDDVGAITGIDDLNREKDEIRTFVKQATRALAET